jgi:hypothetical protein
MVSISWRFFILLVIAAGTTVGIHAEDKPLPVDIRDLICFWDFQEPAGQDRIAKGPQSYRLKEKNGLIECVDDGVFGSHAARFVEGKWMEISRKDCPLLDIHGPKAQVSVVAWIKRGRHDGPRHCEAVAGIWNETRKQRQYCLFLNLGIWNSADQVCGHISSIGGPTPGFKYCMDAAIGAAAVPYGRWQCVGFSYDGALVRAYLNGQLDERSDRNPYRYAGGLFDGGPDGADFTVGAVNRSGAMGNWYTGLIGGLAIYRRALSEDEMRQLGNISSNTVSRQPTARPE